MTSTSGGLQAPALVLPLRALNAVGFPLDPLQDRSAATAPDASCYKLPRPSPARQGGARPLERRPIPARQVGRRLVAALEELEQGRVRVVLGAHHLVRQHEQ